MDIGVIADDITGATDVAIMLARNGRHVVQVIGAPDGPLPQADAVVVALKSRTIPAADAVAISLQSARALKKAGARQIMFKYCSTFDSRDEGNIGQVTEALMDALGADIVISTPAYPANNRSVFQGHLFVGAMLLSDSPMKDHPLTPMRDSNLVRVLQRQTALPVGLLAFADVAKGAAHIADTIARAKADGKKMLIADAIQNDDLLALGEAVRDAPLVAGGAGIALGLGVGVSGSVMRSAFPAPQGPALIISGSCSVATQGQVAAAIAAGFPAYKINAGELMADGVALIEDALAWAEKNHDGKPLLIYSTPDPQELKATQAKYGAEKIGAAFEHALAAIAVALVDRGVQRLIIAGGETSGAVVQALGVKTLVIGPEIDTGVPWTAAVERPGVVIAAKSGNFGAPDFFVKAWAKLGDAP